MGFLVVDASGFIFMKSQAHEQFEETKIEAVRENNVELVQDILKELSPIAHRSQAAEELVRILKEPHFQVCEIRASSLTMSWSSECQALRLSL